MEWLVELSALLRQSRVEQHNTVEGRGDAAKIWDLLSADIYNVGPQVGQPLLQPGQTVMLVGGWRQWLVNCAATFHDGMRIITAAGSCCWKPSWVSVCEWWQWEESESTETSDQSLTIVNNQRSELRMLFSELGNSNIMVGRRKEC